MAMPTMVPMMMMAPMGVKGGARREWSCASCGFKNKATNTQCGGMGPLGCNAPKPMANGGGCFGGGFGGSFGGGFGGGFVSGCAGLAGKGGKGAGKDNKK